VDAVELLTNDHDEVRSLFERFKQAEENEDTPAMRQLAESIFAELDTHTRIEEEIFYPAVKDAGGDELASLVDEGIEEHHVVDVLMREIRALDASEEETFVAKMTVLIENVEHHADEEEQEMFPQVRKICDDTQRAELGERLEAGKAVGDRTRDELYEQARDQGVEGRSSMTKDELADAVEHG
jgi:hemerythrin superfamily protein